MRLILSCSWLKFRRLDASCSWFYPTTDLSFDSWILVVADSILQLTRAPAAGYELRLYFIYLFYFILIWLFNSSHSWLEFQQLDRSCGWFHHMADSRSSSWIGVVADSTTRLTRISLAEHELPLIPSYSCFKFRQLGTSCGRLYPVADSSPGS